MFTTALALLLATTTGSAFRLEDTLRGSTRGNAVGGMFTADGWRVTARTDRVWYAIPRLVSGSVEFTVSNVTMSSLGDAVDNELFAMYEAGYGITEPVRYAPEFRENHYKCMVRIYGNAERGREGQQKLMWGMCPGGSPGFGACGCGSSFFEEPFGGSGVWDGTPQRIRVEWGGGQTRLLRNGATAVTVDWSRSGLTFGPSSLHLSLGTSRPSGVDSAQLPIGAVFSNLVIDGTEGDLARCPGATVTDAGMPMMMTSGSVVTVPAVEDVTVDPAHTTSVYPDVNDLAVGTGDAEFYVKFRVGALPGRVTRAQLILNSATIASAMGTGASVYTAANNTWSENTLTWNARPGPQGSRLARVDGIAVNEVYTFELPASAVPTAGTYAFAVLPEMTDTNSAHFDSKEVSAARGPVLRLTVDPSMAPLVDAGTVAPDVVMIQDAGVIAPDVGTSFPDVAVVRDAGASADRFVFDEGNDIQGGDAGFLDGGPVTGGNCGCRTSSARAPSTCAGALGVIAFAGLVRRRRRRAE
jgi:MYXO-CTERM domain-containing protein